MATRANPGTTHPRLFRRLIALHQQVEQTAEEVGLSADVVELVKTRASQINGCAFCTDMHAQDAQRAGVTTRQLAVLPVWHETELFTDEQRAALALAEAMSTLSQTQQVPDEVYDRAAEVFTAEQLSVLVWAGAVIQTFNALNVTAPKPLPAD
ncbi:carboxymuconolactone decarboxylase family protein [Ruania zhangjianzhongii]|uniref:carboxymuconolactone decarboxylase family protein n=1 Tax=Ruania zhangjianzhongii TaxID=2603206 RepID=UPI0011CC198D|nr:carboxymuconolactone decarboxylase family protein [Ruania zhangjianzhongii]